MHQHTQNAIKMSAPRLLIRLLATHSRSDAKVTNFVCSEKDFVLGGSTIIKSALLFRDQPQSIEQHSKGPVTWALYDNSGGELKIRLLLLVMLYYILLPETSFRRLVSSALLTQCWERLNVSKQRCSLN
jgi:hypothetical protein